MHDREVAVISIDFLIAHLLWITNRTVKYTGNIKSEKLQNSMNLTSRNCYNNQHFSEYTLYIISYYFEVMTKYEG